MQLDTSRLVPLRLAGTGRIARFDATICLVGDDPTRVATAALFDACRNHHGDGAVLVQKVAGILTRAAGATLPPFAIVAQDGDALLLAVHGSVTIVAEQPGGPLSLGGGENGTWATSRVLDAAYLSAATAQGALDAIPALVDLQRGVAVADSFVLLAVGVSPGDLTSSDLLRRPRDRAGENPAGWGHGPLDSPAPGQTGAVPAVPAAHAAGIAAASPVPSPASPVPAAAPESELPPAASAAPAPPRPAEVAGPPPAHEGEPRPPAGPPPEAHGESGPAPHDQRPASHDQRPTPPDGPVPVGPQPAHGFASLADGAFKIVELRPAQGVTPEPPLPTAHEQSEAHGAKASTDDAAVRVSGVHCGRGHFNDPRARYCAVCGLAMFQNSMVLVSGTRPPLGVLLLSNGESYPLARNLVVGREPNNHGDVLNGSADVLIPLTQGPSLSRVHALIRLDGWDVHLIDEGSTNGTFVWDEPNHRWLRLAAGQPTVLRPGDQLAFGELTATFETSLQQ